MAVYSNISGGKQLDVTWSTGTPSVHETYSRIVTSQLFPEDDGDGDGGDLEAFDGLAWSFLSDTDITVKPFVQSWDNFNFQEGSQPSTGCGIVRDLRSSKHANDSHHGLGRCGRHVSIVRSDKHSPARISNLWP